jgi:hypothetical protein
MAPVLVWSFDVWSRPVLPLAELVWLPLSLEVADDVMPPPLELLPPLKPAPVVLLVPVFGLSELPLELMPVEPVVEAVVLAPDRLGQAAAWIADGLLPPVPAPIPAELLGELESVSSRLSWLVEPCCLNAPAPALRVAVGLLAPAHQRLVALVAGQEEGCRARCDGGHRGGRVGPALDAWSPACRGDGRSAGRRSCFPGRGSAARGLSSLL